MTQVAQHIINNPVISHHQRWTTQNRDQRGVYDKKSLVIGKESTDQNESAIVPEMQRGILIKYIIILLFLLYIQCLSSMLELIRTHNADYAITPISAWPSEDLRTIDTLWTHTHTHTLKLPCQLHSNVTICYNYSVRTIVRRRNYTFPIIEPSVLLNAYTALYARIRKKSEVERDWPASVISDFVCSRLFVSRCTRGTGTALDKWYKLWDEQSIHIINHSSATC